MGDWRLVAKNIVFLIVILKNKVSNLVSWYKLFKVMSNVLIQVNKKLGRHYAFDNEYTPVDFFTDSC